MTDNAEIRQITVKEMIEALEKFPQDAIVLVESTNKHEFSLEPPKMPVVSKVAPDGGLFYYEVWNNSYEKPEIIEAVMICRSLTQ